MKILKRAERVIGGRGEGGGEVTRRKHTHEHIHGYTYMCVRVSEKKEKTEIQKIKKNRWRARRAEAYVRTYGTSMATQSAFGDSSRLKCNINGFYCSLSPPSFAPIFIPDENSHCALSGVSATRPDSAASHVSRGYRSQERGKLRFDRGH